MRVIGWYQIMKTKFQNIVIITDVKWRKSLSAIRALGNGQNYIIAIGDSWLDMGLWSKYVAKKLIFPSTKSEGGRFAAELLLLLKKCCDINSAKPILLPMEEETINIVINSREIQNYCKCLIPDKDSFEIANNKRKTMLCASRIGIRIPFTKCYDTPDMAMNFIKEFNDKEWIVKPEESKGSLGFQIIFKDTDVRIVEKLWSQYGRMIIQERLPLEGESICVGLICNKKHEVESYFAYKRLRMFPVNGGPSTCRISINNSFLVKESCRLMTSLKWTGVAMVEWKKDIRDNSYKLIEINPRFWGGLELAIKCGVNFPQQCVELLSRKENSFRNNSYPIGIISRWTFPGEVLWLLSNKIGRKEFGDFFNRFFKDSDEWKREDIPGSVATVICQGLQAMNPKNWKYLKR